MGIGLLNSRNENLLDLFPNNNKLIYDIIDHNFVGLIKTLEIINGKFYINWVNIVPLNTENYNESKISLSFASSAEKNHLTPPFLIESLRLNITSIF